MPPLFERDIEVIIVGDRAPAECDLNCGVDWSSVQMLALASQQVRDRFGDKVHLEYLDLSAAEGNPRAEVLRQKARSGVLSLPALVINGEVRISGHFDMRMLMDAIDAEIEIRKRGGSGNVGR